MCSHLLIPSLLLMLHHIAANSGLPAIQDFIDKHSKQYGKALKISESMGAYPKIILKHKKTGGHQSNQQS